MQFDRAMALLLSGTSIRRRAWVAPDIEAAVRSSAGREVPLFRQLDYSEHGISESGETAYCWKRRAFARPAHPNSDDMMSDDWEAAPDRSHVPTTSLAGSTLREITAATFLEMAPVSATDLLREILSRAGIDALSRSEVYKVQDEMRRLLEQGTAELGRSLHFCRPSPRQPSTES